MKNKKKKNIDVNSMKSINGGFVDEEGNFYSEDEVIMDGMIEMMDNEDVHCYDCKHFKEENETCKAFPDGVPTPIFLGEVRHDEPFEGDNGIRFEKK